MKIKTNILNNSYKHLWKDTYQSITKMVSVIILFFFFFLVWLTFFFFFNFTILYSFCHISTWIPQVYTCSPSWTLLPPRTLPLGCPSAPAPSIQYCASNLDRQLVSYMILYMFQCHSPKSSHPLPLPQSPKDCSIHHFFFFFFFLPNSKHSLFV